MEAWMGVAFRWEAKITAALAMINPTINPNCEWFRSEFLASSKLIGAFKKGCTAVLDDEVFTTHPLVLSALLGACIEHEVVLATLGEALQIASLHDDEYMERGWHTRFAFKASGRCLPGMRWRRKIRFLFFKLGQSFRLPALQTCSCG